MTVSQADSFMYSACTLCTNWSSIVGNLKEAVTRLHRAGYSLAQVRNIANMYGASPRVLVQLKYEWDQVK